MGAASSAVRKTSTAPSPAPSVKAPPAKQQTQPQARTTPRPPPPQQRRGLSIVPGFPRIEPNPGYHDPPLSFLAKSPYIMPTVNNRIENFDPNTIATDACETTVIMHPKIPALCTSFLRYKRQYGSVVEKALYKDMSQTTLVGRLILNRCLHFVQAHDYTVIQDLTSSYSANLAPEWLRVGTKDEGSNKHIKLKDYLSYDEMMLASLLGTSGPSFVINTGTRNNCAQKMNENRHETRAIIVGLVGARLHKPGQMDHALMLPAASGRECMPPFRQQDPGVTKLFRDFFGGGKQGPTFDVKVYKERMRLTIETFLLEADDRAAQAEMTAYAHLVGLGLGVWKHTVEQPRWYVEVLTDCLERLHLNHVSTVEVAWIAVEEETQRLCKDAGKRVGIRVLFNKRPPFEKLDTDELVVRSWAWDSNTIPGNRPTMRLEMGFVLILAGNEYWSGLLDDSDDPAAVCATTVGELHNPFVNHFEHRIKVLQDRPR